jgi:hypothetical protein
MAVKVKQHKGRWWVCSFTTLEASNTSPHMTSPAGAARQP